VATGRWIFHELWGGLPSAPHRYQEQQLMCGWEVGRLEGPLNSTFRGLFIRAQTLEARVSLQGATLSSRPPVLLHCGASDACTVCALCRQQEWIWW
jgi:hypothetical protein